MTTLPANFCLAHSILVYSRKTLHEHQVRSLLSMCGIFLGYSFESRSNNHVLAIVCLVMTIDLLINRRTRTRKKQFDERKQDWLVQKFGLRQLKKFDMIQSKPPFLLLTQQDKRRLCSAQGDEWQIKHQNVKGTKSTKKGSFCGNILIFCSGYKKFSVLLAPNLQLFLTINLT